MEKTKTLDVYGFPSDVNVSDVKRFLEQYTSEESVFFMMIRVTQMRPKACATIQFTTAGQAATMMSLAQNLKYERMDLTLTKDMVPKSTENEHGMDHVKLYFGCPNSEERLSL
ncbi:unnamed protein product [Lathyrus sativus]|nr:unnamed protein product [Lathyrus sativus]